MAGLPLRIALLGKTGVGKSSLANTILGEEVFRVDHTANASPEGCRAETRNVNGTDIKIIDSVGLFDKQRSEDELRHEMATLLVEASPGPHAFLILLKKENFTTQEDDVIKKILEAFTEEIFNHAIIVFTHGDDLQPNETIEDFIRTNTDLQQLYLKCGRRSFVVDNKYWNTNHDHPYRNNQVQVGRLLVKIKDMVEENQGRHYTNQALESVEARRNELIANGMPPSRANNFIINFLKKAVGVTSGVLVGAFLGIPVMIVIVVNSLLKMKTDRAKVGLPAVSRLPSKAVATVATAFTVFAGAGYGAYRGFQEGQQANSVYDAAANTASALVGEAGEQLQDLKDTLRQLHKN